MVSINNAVNNTTGASNSGVTNTFTVQNPSNTANSQATANISVGGDTAGDVWTQYTIGSATSYAVGVDNSNSNYFGINYANSGTVNPSSGNNLLLFDTTNTRANFPIPSMVLNSNASGTTVDCAITNLNNSNTSSHSRINIQVGGNSGGDPYSAYTGGTWSQYAQGVANAVSGQPFRTITTGTPSSPGATLQQITSGGNITAPLDSAFLITLGNSQSNVTGDGTTATVNFDTGVFDQNSNFNTGTHTFTAPVTGRYFFSTSVFFGNLSASYTSGQLAIVTSNRTLQITNVNFANLRRSDNLYTGGGCIFTDMDAADTAIVQATLSNGTKTVSFTASANASWFSGFLQC